MEALLPNYDWVLWTDADYIFQQLNTPLDIFFAEWEAHGLRNVQVFLPHDINPNMFAFSSFAVLIRNSPFGHEVLRQWRAFAKGLCLNGNILPSSREHWVHSDQPGLWYALIQAHAKAAGKEFSITCTKKGFLDVHDILKPFVFEFNQYFQGVFNRSTPPNNVSEVPKDEPIVWSSWQGGLGANIEPLVGFWRATNKTVPPEIPDAVGLHVKVALSQQVRDNLANCSKSCFAGYRPNGTLEAQCGQQGNRVV
jgi:hypothetical protein